MINNIYYHGSTVSNIKQLKINYCSDNPFGPAVYLTKDLRVADCYYRTGGAIYEVVVIGDPKLAINLNKSFSYQSSEAKEAILKSLKFLDLSININNLINTREIIHPSVCLKHKVNNVLVQNGIWLLYGELSGMEKSGLMDRGIQYAVINESKLKVLKEKNS